MTRVKDMRIRHFSACLGLMGLLVSPSSRATEPQTSVRMFDANGVVLGLPSDHQTVVIRHGAISNYMAAMTMPFSVRQSSELTGLHVGDKVSFQLHVTSNDSWVDRIIRHGTVKLPPPVKKTPVVKITNSRALLHYDFTNELGQPVTLSDFPGQALAITFFYTRCPLPNYCPRLSKNFQEASQRLEAMTNGPTNWHFISISFDPEFDTPAMLHAYARSYLYDPKHWSFLTGPKDKIEELENRCGMTTSSSGGTIQHNFRTLIIDASGHLQMVFPSTGDLSGQIVDQILQAAKATNPPASTLKS